MTEINEVLTNSETKFKFLIDSISDVIGELDLDGRISFVSPQVHDMLGYHPDEMIGINFISFFHPDDMPVIRKAMKNATKTMEIVFPKLRIRHKEGKYIPEHD